MRQSLGAHTLGMPAPVWVVGSYAPDGSPNLMVVSWCGICSSSPPCVAISVRKSRQSHANILASQAFTINIPSREHLAETDLLGTISGREFDKFSAAGLTPVPGRVVAAPYVKEFHLALECRVLSSMEVGSHTQFIGEIVEVTADPQVLDPYGAVIAWKLDPLVASPAERAYYGLGSFLAQANRAGLALLENHARQTEDAPLPLGEGARRASEGL